MPPSTGLRARMRAELTNEIKDEARRQLAAEGAPALSLRAVTRSLGMASSAIYRYFPSRDDLLTALIVDAYDAVGAAAEEADARCSRRDYGGRWRTVGLAIRGWAIANPHEYALVYGSPVPGYRAPQDTVGPASRVTLVLARIVDEASGSGHLAVPTGLPGLPPPGTDLLAETRRLADLAFPHVPDEAIVRALAAWTQLFGMISFELFGHFHAVVDDMGPVFERSLLETARLVGLPAPRTARTATDGRAARTGPASADPGGGEGPDAGPDSGSDAGPDAGPDGDDEVWYLI
jgi:AcrR family transcriptional regulator